jgi:hypothetical protein
MHHPVDTSANWSAQELNETADWITHVHCDDAILRTMSGEVQPTDRFLNQLDQISADLETGLGVTLIRGLQIGSLSQDTLESLFLSIGERLGTPVSQSADGDLIFSVRDAGFGPNDARTRGPNTNKKLSFHTDRCDVIGFLCVQQAKSGGENQIVSSVALYNQILNRRPDLLEVLMKPFLYKRHNVDTGNDQPFCEQPVFSFRDGHFACAFLRVLIDRAYADDRAPDMTDQQKEALDFLEAVAAEPQMQIRMTQQPGDILLLNNWVTLHRRTAFEDWPEPERQRHILRMWLSVPNSRPLDPMFEANYGAVGAGAIRGGIHPKQV